MLARMAEAQTPGPSPDASPVATPEASPKANPIASPAATPVATPLPDYPLDIIHESDLNEAGTPVPGGALRIPVSRANLTQFAPPLQRQDPLVAWSYLDPLVRIDPVTMEPRPGLATRWSWSADGLQLTFNLRADVLWHDGRRFTAADAAFTHVAYRDDYQSMVAGQSGLVAGISADGDDTLKVTFAEPDGAWVYNVASLPIFQREQYLSWWDRNPPGERTVAGIEFDGTVPQGTGPWKIESFDLTGVTFARNDDYFDDPPFAEALEFIAVDDLAERLKMWRNGELDLIPDIAPLDVEDLRYEPARLVVVDAARSVFGAFNFDNPGRWEPDLLADPTVREAVNIALDRDRMATGAYAGFLRSDQSGVIAQPWAHDSSIRNPAQDLKRAARLMHDAGWKDTTGDGILESPAGDAFVLSTLVLDSVGPEVPRMLELANQDLRKIGGAIGVEVLPRDRFIERWQVERTWDLIVYDLRLYPAFAEFDLFGSAWDIRANPAGWNPGGYSNPDADAAINAWFESVSEPEMTAALDDLQHAVNEDLFGIWFGFPQDLVLLNDSVRGFRPNRLLTAGDTRLMWKASPGDATPVADRHRKLSVASGSVHMPIADLPR